MSAYRICPVCGCLVGDVEAHIAHHGDLTTDAQAQLRYGHPRDWPKTPGAPLPPPPPVGPEQAPPVTPADPPTDQPDPDRRRSSWRQSR